MIRSSTPVQHMPNFPFSLESLKACPVNLGSENFVIKIQPNSSLYEVIQPNLSKFSIECYVGSISPTSLVNLNQSGRTLANIPETAQRFAWFYPLADIAGRQEQLQDAGLDTAQFQLLYYGGYAYFDNKMKVVAINSVAPGQSIFFSSPKPLPRSFTTDLRRDGRYQPVTLAHLLQAGAETFCWITPYEKVSSVDRNEWPFGAFAYSMKDKKQDAYFSVMNPNPLDVSLSASNTTTDNNSTISMESTIIGDSTATEELKNILQTFQNSLSVTSVSSIKVDLILNTTQPPGVPNYSYECITENCHNPRTTMFFPCQHLMVCATCATELNACPKRNCNEQIVAKMKINSN